MHSPRHSFGDNSAQPSTPCSASGECGGRRSTVGRASERSGFCRRAFFKSVPAPALVAPCKGSETESIIPPLLPKREIKGNNSKAKDVTNGLWKNYRFNVNNLCS